MTSIVARLSRVAIMAAAVSLLAATSYAQSISTFNGGSGASETAQTGWTTSGNWSPSGVPSGTNVWALINSQTATALRIAYTSLSGTLNVGAISFLPTLQSSGTTLDFRNSSTNTTGTIRFYGIDTTINGIPRRIILDNQTSLSNIGVSTGTSSGGSTFGQEYELFTSGAINVAANTSLTLAPLIKDGGGSARSITKVGSGVLSFNGVSYATVSSNSSANSTYSGGFILEGGIVQWALSGSGSASPFGVGPVTLRSGTLRSTTTSGRSINTNVILDGAVELGSTAPGLTGDIDVNSAGGTRSTTILSDSIVSIAGSGTTAWAQATSGSASLTKAGSGALRFSGVGGPLTHTGSTVVQAGRLIMNANLSSASAVSVLNGASLFGTGTIAGATSILSGGTFSPGTTSNAAGLFTFGSGGLTLGGQTVMELTGTARGVTYDAVNLGSGVLTYGGGMSLSISGTYGDLAELKLFDFSGAALGDFTSVTASGVYGTVTLTNDGFGVWSSEPTIIAGQTLRFTQSTGVLAFVPEPSAIALAGLGAAAAAWTRRRCRRRFTQAA